MTVTPGTRLGPYEILAPLGVGGMGEVYRAHDTKLHRDVAIKVLPESLGADPDRLARFEREAHLLASLNHPHIAQIHGFEDSSTVPALIMELVEGPTLADRLAAGAIPIDEALAIARQIADALDAAHEHGIVHRDLKPANIKVRDDGTVKVLDFGLAKAVSHADAKHLEQNVRGVRLQADLTASPTLTTPAQMTSAGVILGTAAYMSPEQARGQVIDKRTDTWAFGCVLFEMLTGEAAFTGANISDTVASILRDEPKWNALPTDTPATIQKLLRRCLQKNRKDRLADANDGRLEIVDAVSAPRAHPGPTTHPQRRAERIGLAAFVAGSTVTGFAVWGAMTRSHTAAPADLVRFAIHDSERVIVSRVDGDIALSPDGRTIAFFGYGDGGGRIWLRTIDTLEARPLPGTEGAGALAWLPDGRTLGFTTGARRIKRLAISTSALVGVELTLRASQGRSLAWGPDGSVVFRDGSRIRRMPADGTAPQTFFSKIPEQDSDDAVVSATNNAGELQWVARSGRVLERIDQAFGAGRPAVSSDGTRVAMALRDDIWVLDGARGVLSRFTSHDTGGATVGSPVWSSDGRSLFFHRNGFSKDGNDALIEAAYTGGRPETVVRQSSGRHAHATDVSPDGRYLVYDGEEEPADIWLVSLTGDFISSVVRRSDPSINVVLNWPTLLSNASR